MAKGVVSGIVTAIVLLGLFVFCVFLSWGLMIGGIMGASAPTSSGKSSALIIFGPVAVVWIVFMLIAVAAVREKPAKIQNVTAPSEPNYRHHIVGMTLFSLFALILYKLFL